MDPRAIGIDGVEMSEGREDAPGARAPAPGGAKAWAARLVVGSLSLALALGLAEAAVRLAGPGVPGAGAVRPHPAGMYLPDEELGYRLRPGFTGVFEKESFTMSIEIDERGFRRAPGGDDRKGRVILVLGDSFTFGIGVEGGRTFCARLEAMLDDGDPDAFRVVNAGVPGYGTASERILLERILEPVRPELVLLCFYPNDLLDNAVDARSRMVVNEEGYLVRRWEGKEEAPWTWASRGIVPLPFKGFLRERSALYGLLQFHFRRLVERESLPRNWVVEGGMDPLTAYARLGGDYLYLDGESDVIRALWSEEFRLLDAMERRVSEAGARLVVVLLPTGGRIYPGPRKDAAWWLNLDPGLFDDERVAAAFSRYARDRGRNLPIVDLAAPLIRARDSGGRLYHRGDDRHFTERGHEVAAEAIHRALIAEGGLDG